MADNDELAKVDKNLATRLGGYLRTQGVPDMARGAEQITSGILAAPKAVYGTLRDIYRGYQGAENRQVGADTVLSRIPTMSAGFTNRGSVTPSDVGLRQQTPPQLAGTVLPRTPTTSADFTNRGSITTPDGTVSLQDLEGGFSRGNIGLRGQGSYSMVDMSGLPDRAAAGAAPSQGLRNLAPMQPMETYIQQSGDAGGSVRLRPAGSGGGTPNYAETTAVTPAPLTKNYRRLYQNKGARSAAIARDTALAGIRARKQQEANIRAAKLGLTARGQDLTAEAAGERNALDAATLDRQLDRDEALNSFTEAQTAVTQLGAQQSLRNAALYDAYQNETDPVRKRRLRDEYLTAVGKTPPQEKVHFANVGLENDLVAIGYGPQGIRNYGDPTKLNTSVAAPSRPTKGEVYKDYEYIGDEASDPADPKNWKRIK